MVEAVFARLAADRAALWVATPDGWTLAGAHGVTGAPERLPDPAGLTEVFGAPPTLVRTPADPAAEPVAVIAVVTDQPPALLQRILDEAAGVLRLLQCGAADGVLEALSDQAAVLDPDGVVVRVNGAWSDTPAPQSAVVARSRVGTHYPATLEAQGSRPARIAADGIRAVLAGALPGFQSDYDTDVDAGRRSFSLQVDPLPAGGAVVRHIDISFRKHLQRQLAHRATHDPLTGLPNRMVMVDRLGQALIRSARTGGGVALLFCDVDRFKQINDSQGHAVGDQVLEAIARRLQNTARQSDVVARFGGDEFVVLLEDVADEQTAQVFAKDLQAALTHPIVVEGRPLHFGVSVGIAMHPGRSAPDSREIAALLADADAAMYAAKLDGRGSVHVFEPADRDAKRDPAQIAPALRTAALNDEIRMLVQPIVDLRDGRMTGYESLVRWDLPAVGRLSPADFLQTAEETGAIVEIGRSILRQTLWFAAALPERVRVSANVSWTELAEESFPDTVLSSLDRAGVPAHRLDLEVVLPAAAEPASLSRLHTLAEHGVGITLDAFGRVPVDLAMLPDVRATTLKVDRALTVYATRGGAPERLLAEIVGLADRLGLSCVAEGVETRAQAEAAAALGFQRGQGFYFGKPADPQEFLD